MALSPAPRANRIILSYMSYGGGGGKPISNGLGELDEVSRFPGDIVFFFQHANALRSVYIDVYTIPHDDNDTYLIHPK